MKQTLILTGDIHLGHVADPTEPFALVADVLGEADVVFGNLEGCLYDSEDELPYKTGWRHAGTAGARALVRGGFHAVGCANNVTFGHEAQQFQQRVPLHSTGLRRTYRRHERWVQHVQVNADVDRTGQ